MGLSELRPVLPDGFRAGEYSAFRCLPAISNGVEFGRYSMVFVRTSIRQSRKVIDYVTAQWRLISIRKNIDTAFTNFDLVALPTMRITPRTINDSLNREEEPKPREPETGSNCTPVNIVGLPAISLPCGLSHEGLPIGLMTAGPRLSDGTVFAPA